MFACFICVFIVAIDVILRKASHAEVSIPGSNEMSQYLLVVMCMFAIPTLQIKKGHVLVDMFVNMFPAKMRSIWMGVILLLETLIACAFVYGCASYAATNAGRLTDVLNMPYEPFCYLCAFGFLEFAVILAVDTIQCFIDAAHGGEKKEAAAE